MRTETRTRTLYHLHELPEHVQKKACEKFMIDEPSWDWWEDTYSDFEEICKIIGVDLDRKSVKLLNGKERTEPEIFFSGFWSQGDGASFFGRYRYAKDSKKKIREHYCEEAELIRITDALFAIQKAHMWGLSAEITKIGYHYSHSNTMGVEVDFGNRTYNGEVEKEVRRLLRDLADWLYKQLEEEHEYQTSFESFKERCEGNDYEFTADGVLV